MFVLCGSCAAVSQRPPCPHSDDERRLSGTWTTIEVLEALDNGYEMMDCHEIWHFEQSSETLFRDYMNRFLANKVQSGGYPAWCDTDEKKTKYIADYEEVEGVVVDPDKVKKNPSMYTSSKLNLNTLWGKFGQRQNLGSMKLVNSEEQFWQLLLSNQLIISDIGFFGERYAQISYKEHEDLCLPGLNTNVVIAAFTTAYARLHLWQYLNKLGDRVLYFDTDSVVFVHRDGDYCPPVGDFLGEFKSEFQPEEWCVEFVGAGPKNYGMRLNTGKTNLSARLHPELPCSEGPKLRRGSANGL
jgi:hypothetical protein